MKYTTEEMNEALKAMLEKDAGKLTEIVFKLFADVLRQSAIIAAQQRHIDELTEKGV